MKSMVFKILGSLHVVVAGQREPTREDWAGYMNAVRLEERRGTDPTTSLRTLVFSDGGGPNAEQRKQINEFLKGRTTPIAFVTTSTFFRGIVSALQWFNPAARAFSPDNVVAALRFLDVPASQHQEVWATAKALWDELGRPELKSIDPQLASPPGT